MITTAEEFERLRNSELPEEYNRSAHEAASEQVWLAVLASYPEMTFWVIHNKTVPLAILELLANHPDKDVRWAIASKRKLSTALFEQLAVDTDEYVRLAIATNRKTPRHVL